MNLRPLVSLFLLLTCFVSYAQNGPKFGEVTIADFSPKFYAVDSSAEAVVLYDGGSAKYEGNSDSWFNIIYTYHKRIRILNKNAFDLATVQIPLFKSDDKEDELDKLEAATYTTENGQVVKTKLDKASVFKDKASSNVTVKKFTFPNIKEGCIIEYTYTVISPRALYMRDWYFQGRYPVLQSTYETAIPALFNFVFLDNGYYDLQPVNTESTENYRIFFKNSIATGGAEVANYNGTVIHSKWTLSDLPGMRKENYIGSIDNYISKIEFQLRSITFPNAEPKPFMQTWSQMVTDMLKREDFGADLSGKNSWLEDDLARLPVKNDTLQTARNIHAFVRQNFIFNGEERKFLTDDLKAAYRAKKGSTADINLVLVAMLRKAGITADPVLLSTRANGFAYEEYPLLFKFNYVIARALINGKEYLLDASEKKIGFNRLPEYCYNGFARIINPDMQLIPLFADSLREAKTTTIYISNSEDGKNLSGSFNSDLGYDESYALRNDIGSSGQEDYFKKLKNAYTYDVNIKNEGIDSLTQYDERASVHYDFSFGFTGDIVYFNPLLTEAYKDNPFMAATRNYPVEMPSASDEVIIVNMEIPRGYKVDELPAPVRLKLNDNDGMFEYLTQADAQMIQLRCRLKMNKATFTPDDYNTLRDFFSHVVKKQAEQIVFRKIK